MDLLTKGCHLCDDWPCVNACEPKALAIFETDDEIRVNKMAAAEVNTDACLSYSGPECGACGSVWTINEH